MVTVAEGPCAWTIYPRRSAASGASFWEGTDASEDLQASSGKHIWIPAGSGGVLLCSHSLISKILQSPA